MELWPSRLRPRKGSTPSLILSCSLLNDILRLFPVISLSTTGTTTHSSGNSLHVLFVRFLYLGPLPSPDVTRTFLPRLSRPSRTPPRRYTLFWVSRSHYGHDFFSCDYYDYVYSLPIEKGYPMYNLPHEKHNWVFTGREVPSLLVRPSLTPGLCTSTNEPRTVECHRCRLKLGYRRLRFSVWFFRSSGTFVLGRPIKDASHYLDT